MKKNKLTVIHANDLVDASYSLSINEMRLIILAAIKIDSHNAINHNEDIIISVDEFVKKFNSDDANVYRDIKEAAKSIMRKPIKIKYFDQNQKKDKVIELAWLVKNEYALDSKSGTHIKIKFSPEISPYLFELKNRFTSVNFNYISKLNTFFSFRIYQWLSKYKNFKSHYDMSSNKINVILTVDWIKDQLQLNERYKLFADFKKRVIEPSIKKINTHTDFHLNYDVIKLGRKVSALKFIYSIKNDKESSIVPIRPRLKRKSKNDKEDYWAKENLKQLINYENRLFEFNQNKKLAKRDLLSILKYCDILGDINLKKHYKKKLEVMY